MPKRDAAPTLRRRSSSAVGQGTEFTRLRRANSGHSGRFWILLLVGKGAQVRGASPVKLPRRRFLHLVAGAAHKTDIAMRSGDVRFWG
jgi:hypothetical protein